MRSWLSISAAVVVSLFALHAGANSGGIKGKSGKDGASCSGCHKGGAAPTVTIEGPDELAAGASGNFTLTIKTTLAKGSAGIASDTGTLTAGTGLKADGDELTQTAAIDATAGEAKFGFKVKAPASGATFKIWGAGLASDGVGAAEGDADATATKEVTVTGGTTKAATTADDTKGTSSSSGSTKKKTTSSSSGSADDDTGIPNSGCAAAPERGDALSALGVLVVLGAFLKATRRKSA